jgi:hypothetical protein
MKTNKIKNKNAKRMLNEVKYEEMTRETEK